MLAKKRQLMRPVLYLALFACLLSGCREKAGPAPSWPEVRYMEVTEEKITLTRELPGRVSAFTSSEVRPQVSGIIQARLFEEGTDVRAGQELYRIDPTLYRTAFKAARANLARSQANEEAARLRAQRYRRLAQTGSAGVQERDDAVAAYDQLKAEIAAHEQALETARVNLGYTRITAPVSGRIGRSFVTEGALVTQNQTTPLAKIQKISPVNVDITQSSAQMLRLRRALASGALKSDESGSAGVRLYLEDGTPYTRSNGQRQDDWLEGELMFSGISVSESTGAVSLRARFENPDGLLLPGMYVRAVLVEGMLDAVLIPQKSVTRDAGNAPRVFVLTPAGTGKDEMPDIYKVEARTVTIDRDYEHNWIVSSGLKPGERLVVDGLQKVRPGQLVRGIGIARAEERESPGGNSLSSSESKRR
jgi:membrane fusion protein (multidrug efflux system)